MVSIAYTALYGVLGCPPSGNSESNSDNSDIYIEASLIRPVLVNVISSSHGRNAVVGDVGVEPTEKSYIPIGVLTVVLNSSMGSSIPGGDRKSEAKTG